MHYKNLMVDIETLSTKPNALILSIGAVFFCTETGELGPEFYTKIDPESAQAYGGVIDASTVIWWLSKSENARKEITDKTSTKFSLPEALWLFNDYISTNSISSELQVWGNGSDFDNVILASAYSSIEQTTPWEFYNNRCYRTLKNLYPSIKMDRSGTHHNALDDAISQAQHALRILSDFTASTVPAEGTGIAG